VFQREAQAAASSLRHFARRGRVVPERHDERLRELIVGNSYRLIYRLFGEDEVHVIAFVNAARDLDAFLTRTNRD
jgi:plasmid stabilization system protein ParE